MSTQSIDLKTPKKIDLDAGRRAFFKTAGLAAAGAAVLGATGFPKEAAAQQVTDFDILNLALNLEYLEAEFYLRAVFGRGLADSDATGTGADSIQPVSGGSVVPFQDRLVQEYAREIAEDEERHVRFLRKALGSAAVARPPINLRESFTAAATAAGLISVGQTFDPFASEDNFLLGSFIFEDVGVTAYKGAAPLLSNAYIGAAAGILAVEAYHAGIIRTILSSRGAFVAAGAISEVRDNGTDVDQGLQMVLNDDSGTPVALANLVPTDAEGLAFGRTPQQVLSVVYLGPTPSPVSFFPVGTFGNIR